MTRLYRIILVDDEEEVRKSIIKIIDWEKAGFEVIGDAENGEDALELVDQYEPDLVLTDIRMPYMDGLTLAGKIRQTHPSIKVIIFSGYDDFEYAKEAIKLNIVEYILKPVNAEELFNILLKVKARMDEEIERIKNIDELKETFAKNLPILKENFLKNIMHGRIESAQIPVLEKEYGLNIADAEKWTVILVSFKRIENMESEKTGFENETQLIPISVRKLLAKYLENCCRYEIFNSSTGLCALLSLNSSNSLDEIILVLRDVCREAKNVLSLHLTIGIGQPRNSLSDMPECYEEAHEAVSYDAIAGIGVIYIHDVEPFSGAAPQLTSDDEHDFTSAIKFGTEKEIQACVNRLIEKMQSAHMRVNEHQAYLISMMDILLQTVRRNELEPESIFGEKFDYLEILSRLQNDEILRGWLVETCIKINRMINAGRESSTQSMIKSAKKYIENNYMDPDISLETICAQLHISSAYFSTIFKKETGESYSSYLTHVRLEKAADLLGTTDDKTYLIARQVGYEEPNYFGYVFKKQYGMTPSKFRGKSS